MKTFCVYCNGDGYLQLLTGGSETCPSCLGSGQEAEGMKENYTVPPEQREPV